MYTSTFIFESKPYDEDFLRMDAEIAQRARAIPGFLGEEAWDNPETGLHAEVYYWDNQDALRQLIAMPVHQEAKRLHERWIGRYRVVIAEVLTTYGDDTSVSSTAPSSRCRTTPPHRRLRKAGRSPQRQLPQRAARPPAGSRDARPDLEGGGADPAAGGHRQHESRVGARSCWRSARRGALMGEWADAEGRERAFGPVIAINQDSPPLHQALGLSGRDPGWRPPSS